MGASSAMSAYDPKLTLQPFLVDVSSWLSGLADADPSGITVISSGSRTSSSLIGLRMRRG